MIHKVYKEKKLSSLSSNNKFQLYVEHAIQKALEENRYKPLYLSHTQLLEKLHLVNNNYRIFNDRDNQDLLIGWITNREFYSRNSLATASKILYQWADRRLEKMEERGFITYEDGYCLVREDKAGKSMIKMVTNVSVGSDLERSVKDCYTEAYGRIFPNSKNSSSWIHPDYQNAFSFELRKCLKKHIGEEYVGAYKVKVICLTATKSRMAALLYARKKRRSCGKCTRGTLAVSPWWKQLHRLARAGRTHP